MFAGDTRLVEPAAFPSCRGGEANHLARIDERDGFAEINPAKSSVSGPKMSTGTQPGSEPRRHATGQALKREP